MQGQEFLSAVPFIIFFLVLVLILKLIAGAKVVFWFLSLVLLSMVLLNPALIEKVTEKIKFD